MYYKQVPHTFQFSFCWVSKADHCITHVAPWDSQQVSILGHCLHHSPLWTPRQSWTSLFSIQNHQRAAFETSPMHTSCWHPRTWGMTILYLDLTYSCICYWPFYTNVWHVKFYLWYQPLPLITYQRLSVIPIQLLLKDGCHANGGADIKYGGSISFISMHLLWKFLNTSVSSKV